MSPTIVTPQSLITRILDKIARLEAEKAQYQDCPGSLAEIEIDLSAARRRLSSLR